ncbi:hypothetical protein FK521_27630, partial [Klebsiella pneumoniae]|nr:hypothetical protein [Klebsiella pneumoniae]
AWLIRFWSPVPAVIAAGILSTYYFGITGTFWAVTGEFTRFSNQLSRSVSSTSPPSARTHSSTGRRSRVVTNLEVAKPDETTDIAGEHFTQKFVQV